MGDTPFKMKGNPFQRNFGTGSPVKKNNDIASKSQDVSKKAGKKKKEQDLASMKWQGIVARKTQDPEHKKTMKEIEKEEANMSQEEIDKFDRDALKAKEKGEREEKMRKTKERIDKWKKDKNKKQPEG
mgnify:CR=1 FL=1